MVAWIAAAHPWLHRLMWLPVVLIPFAALETWAVAKIFAKAGRNPWVAVVPVVSSVCLAAIVGRPRWWAALLFIPGVNIAIALLLYVDLLSSFGLAVRSQRRLWLPWLGVLIVGFGDSTYAGPKAGAAS